MTGSSATRESFSPGDAGDRESFRQLIELQKQIIELVDQNSETERRCVLLRQQLAREAEEMFVRSRSVRHRLRRAAARLFKKLYSINHREDSTKLPRPDLRLLPPARHAQGR